MIKRLATLALLVAVCAVTHARDVTLGEVEKMEALWKSQGVTTYSFSPWFHSFGGRLMPRVRILVVRSKVRQIRLASESGAYTGAKISAKRLRQMAPFPLTI